MSPAGNYRIFVGAFPTGELAERIQALRKRYDAKTARITAPHVTMAGTYWHKGPPTPENEAETIRRLQTIEEQLQPFDLVLGGVETFLPHVAVLYLQVQSTPGLLEARRLLLQALGMDKNRNYTPHLTLAMRLGEGQLRSLLAQLRQSEWGRERWAAPIDHLWLMQRGPEGPAWRYIYRVTLAKDF